MKLKLTLFFIFLVSLMYAQDYYYNDQPMLGLGVGYNFISIVDNDVRPIELSFRYRINNEHMLQLYLPFMQQDDLYKSKGHPDMELIATSLDTEKRVYGIGLDYDYALQSYMSLDFVVGLRVEYQLYNYRTNLTNNYTKSDTELNESFDATDRTYRNKKTRNLITSPNAGFRLRLNRFFIDAKFLTSMLSIRGDVDNRIESRKYLQSNIVSTTEEWTDHISNKFKLKPTVMMSISYFF